MLKPTSSQKKLNCVSKVTEEVTVFKAAPMPDFKEIHKRLMSQEKSRSKPTTTPINLNLATDIRSTIRNMRNIEK